MDMAHRVILLAAFMTVVAPTIYVEAGASPLGQGDSKMLSGVISTMYAAPNFGGESVSFGCVLDPLQFHSVVKFKVASLEIRQGFTAWLTIPSARSDPHAVEQITVHGRVADVDAAWKGGITGVSALCASVVNTLDDCPESSSWPNAPCATVLVKAGGSRWQHAPSAEAGLGNLSNGRAAGGVPPPPSKGALNVSLLAEASWLLRDKQGASGQAEAGLGKLANGGAAGGVPPPPSKGALYHALLAEAASVLREKQAASSQGAGSVGAAVSKEGAPGHGDVAAGGDAGGAYLHRAEASSAGQGRFSNNAALGDQGAVSRQVPQTSPRAVELPPSNVGTAGDIAAPVLDGPHTIPPGCLAMCPADLTFRSQLPPAGASMSAVARSRKLLRHHRDAPPSDATQRLGVVVVFCTDHGYKRILDELSCDRVDVIIYSKCGNEPSIPDGLQPCTTVNAGEHSPAGVNALSILEHLYLYYDRLHEVTLFLKDTLPHDMRKHVWDIVAAIGHNHVGYYAFTEAIRDMLVQDMNEFYLHRMNDTEFVPTVLRALQCKQSSFHGVPASSSVVDVSSLIAADSAGKPGHSHFSWQRPFVLKDCDKLGKGRAELRPRDVLHCGDPLATAWATDYWRTAVHSVFAVARNRVWMWPRCKYAGFATYIKDWFNRSQAPKQQKGQASWWLFERIWGEIFHCRPARHHDGNFVCLGDELVSSQETLDDLPQLLKP